VDKEGDAIGYFCFSNYYKSTDSLMDMNLTTALCHDIEKFPGLWDLTITEVRRKIIGRNFKLIFVDFSCGRQLVVPPKKNLVNFRDRKYL
jgi:hypothetical protein